METVITLMQLSDLEELKEKQLVEQFDDFWTFSVLKQELENKQNLNSQYFIARQKLEIVGFSGMINICDEVSIMNIVVRKDKRMLGIGSLLLEFMIQFCKNQNAISITLEVNEKNSPAIALYKKYGFIQVGLRKKYYHHSDNAVLMTLLLKD